MNCLSEWASDEERAEAQEQSRHDQGGHRQSANCLGEWAAEAE